MAWKKKKQKTKPESAGHCALPRGWTHDTPGQLNQDLEAANPFLGVESFSAGWELPATRLGAWWSFLKQLCLTAQSLLQLPCKTRSEPQPWNTQFQRAHPRARAEATESSPLGCSRGHQEVWACTDCLGVDLPHSHSWGFLFSIKQGSWAESQMEADLTHCLSYCPLAKVRLSPDC